MAVRLSQPNQFPGPDGPIAWAIDPVRLSQRVEVSREFRLSPQATFAEIELGVGEVTKSTKVLEDRNYVIGIGKGESVVEWTFRETKYARLEGMHDLKIVIKSTGDDPVVAETILSAKIERGVKPLSYRANIPPYMRSVQIVP